MPIRELVEARVVYYSSVADKFDAFRAVVLSLSSTPAQSRSLFEVWTALGLTPPPAVGNLAQWAQRQADQYRKRANDLRAILVTFPSFTPEQEAAFIAGMELFLFK